MYYIIYQFLTETFFFISLLIFFTGIIYRLIWYIKGLNWQLDRVSYNVNTFYGIKGAIRSIFYWIIPFGTKGWRFYPKFTILIFIFHTCLIITPLFLLSHNILINKCIDINLWSFPEFFSDLMTIIVISSSLFIIFRRIIIPEVRILTTFYDILLLLITILPFLTGFLIYHQIGQYDILILLHILFGEIMLISIPFTKLSHFILFFLSRGQIGFDFGIKRGGMKNKGINW